MILGAVSSICWMQLFFCSLFANCRITPRCRSPPACPPFPGNPEKKEDKPMAKPYRIPDYRKMYPEASEEVIAVLRTTERKMQYQEYDLKTGQTVISGEGQAVTTMPGREDSLERLAGQEVQFASETEGVEETVLRRIQYAQLHKALSLLSDDERELVDRLFFRGQTEREAAAEMGIYRNAIHKRKNRILEKLKNFLEKF